MPDDRWPNKVLDDGDMVDLGDYGKTTYLRRWGKETCRCNSSLWCAGCEKQQTFARGWMDGITIADYE